MILTMNLIILRFLLIGSFFSPLAAWSNSPLTAEEDQTPLSFESWMEDLEAEAFSQGISVETFKKSRKYMVFDPAIGKLDHVQLTSKKPIEDYMKFLTPKLLKKWGKLIHENAGTLQEMGEKYGVEPEYIAAIWAMETRCGKVMGSFNVLSALTTLSFQGRRQEFFREELLTALQLVEKGYVHPKNFLGSWAGAVGQCQFMPTSFSKYAVDEDGDGCPNIWNSKKDVFGSIANYFKAYGWVSHEKWGRQVRIPKTLYKKIQKNPDLYSQPRSLKEWRHLGVQFLSKQPVPSSNLQASLVCPLSREKKVYLVYSNFEVIKKYNKSTFYAIGIGKLADHFRGYFKPLKMRAA
jgi:membrane-bound lytic murein transglycosylase B